MEMKDYKAKNHYLCMLKWVFKAVEENKQRTQPKKSRTAQELEASYDMMRRWAQSDSDSG